MSTQDWPFDPDGEEGSEGRRKYGHAVLVKKIDEEEDFPLRAGEYAEEFAEHPIRIDANTIVSVADIFEDIDGEETYDDLVEFHRAVGATMRSAGYWAYEGADQFTRARG